MKEHKFAENCMVCGAELDYLDQPAEASCVYCGVKEQSYVGCPSGHYVCNRCHANEALIKITHYCLHSTSKNPILMLEEIMADERISMHGPEHHAVVPAILVTAYRNVTGKLGEKAILEAIRRGSQVPGGYCGIFGACGAGIGAGIAVSVVTGSTPLRAEPRALSNLMTAKALTLIGEQGGVRCCKACSRTAVQAAVEFFAKNLDCHFETNPVPACNYMKRNTQCNLNTCKYFPVKSRHNL